MQQDVSLEVRLDQHHRSKQGLKTRRVIYLAIGHAISFPCLPHLGMSAMNGVESPVVGLSFFQRAKRPCLVEAQYGMVNHKNSSESNRRRKHAQKDVRSATHRLRARRNSCIDRGRVAVGVGLIIHWHPSPQPTCPATDLLPT